MGSLNSKYGWRIFFHLSLFQEIYSAMNIPFSEATAEKRFAIFDEIIKLQDDVYKVRIKEATFLVDDSDPQEIRYYWRSKDWKRTIAKSSSRVDVSKLNNIALSDRFDSKNSIINRYVNTSIFYIADNDKSLALPDFKEILSFDEDIKENCIKYVEDGIVMSPSLGWLEILKEWETINTTVVFENEDADKSLSLYSNKKITEGIDPKNLWLQDLVHTIRNNVSGDHLVQLTFRHFPTAPENSALRKSLVLCNKIKAVIKLSWSLFWKKESDVVYLLVIKPKENDGGIGKILLGDFVSKKWSDSFYKDLTGVLVSFLNGKLFTSPMGTKTLKNNELKEPFALDPSIYIK